jgi:hypothetical protein
LKEIGKKKECGKSEVNIKFVDDLDIMQEDVFGMERKENGRSEGDSWKRGNQTKS